MTLIVTQSSYVALNDKFSIHWLTHNFWYFLLLQMSQLKSLSDLHYANDSLNFYTKE